MKKIITAFLIFLSVKGDCQGIIDSLNNLAFNLQDPVAEKLAELAVTKNPNLTVLDKQIEANMYEMQKNKMSLLNNLTASFNLNEGNLKAKDPNSPQAAFYPRYNFNLSFPLGSYFTKSKDTKRSRAIYEGSQASKEAEMIRLREAIKTNYQVYQSNKYLLALQEAVMQDESLLLSQVVQKFGKNEVGLEIFTNASKRYNAEMVKKLGLLRDVNISRINLETLLGMDLDAALITVGAPGKR